MGPRDNFTVFNPVGWSVCLNILRVLNKQSSNCYDLRINYCHVTSLRWANTVFVHIISIPVQLRFLFQQVFLKFITATCSSDCSSWKRINCDILVEKYKVIYAFKRLIFEWFPAWTILGRHVLWRNLNFKERDASSHEKLKQDRNWQSKRKRLDSDWLLFFCWRCDALVSVSSIEFNLNLKFVLNSRVLPNGYFTAWLNNLLGSSWMLKIHRTFVILEVICQWNGHKSVGEHGD